MVRPVGLGGEQQTVARAGRCDRRWHRGRRRAQCEPVSRADLNTFGYGNARLGAAPSTVGISTASARRLGLAWRTNVGGAVKGQPLVADAVRVGRRLRNLVFVATQHGRVVALDADTGALVWRHRVASRTITPDCQASPDGVFGVTGTMLIDRAAGRLYAVDVNGNVWALRLDSGKIVPGWPVRVSSAPSDFFWSGLALPVVGCTSPSRRCATAAITVAGSSRSTLVTQGG